MFEKDIEKINKEHYIINRIYESLSQNTKYNNW